MSERAAALETRGLCKHYERGTVAALRGVDVRFDRGEFIAIMGPSGSGKSTFLNLAGTLDRPSSGRVLLEGEDVTGLRRLHEVRRRKIGFVFQFHHLIPNLSLLDNAMIPLHGSALPRRQRAARARELLDRVGLGHRIRHRANQVSGGERQRAAIARALVNQPTILLADEPTGNLDSVTGRRVLDVLTAEHQRRGTLLVVVTHNAEVAARADRVLHFRDGMIARPAPADPQRDLS